MPGERNKTDRVDVVIIGAGVIGLAVAAEISSRRPGLGLVLVEKNETFGLETSSRNSEVIHSGIYYPPGSLKARLCVEGSALLYRFCDDHGINYTRCGKVIVAGSPAEEDSLDRLQETGAANGVDDLELLTAVELGALEPNIRAVSALYSPSTGVVDSHSLMACLEQVALQNSVLPAYCHCLESIEKLPHGYRLSLTIPDGSSDQLDTDYLVNCAGLQADRVASMAGINLEEASYKQYLCKGEYFSLPYSMCGMVSRLIYPPPLLELTGLGIHLTKTLDGRLRLGPNALYVEQEEYSVDPAHSEEFYRAVTAFIPFIKPGDPEPEMAGIRPKLSGPGQPFRDFEIKEESGRGLPGLVNLIGIESPGLTCALSIARLVADLVIK